MELKELIKEKNEYTVGALIALYKYQTPDEQAHNATAYDNQMGFNAVDAPILSDLSKFYLKRGYLTDNQIRLARTKLLKYIGQLSAIEVKPLSIKTMAKKEEVKDFKNASIDSETSIILKFKYDNDLVQEVKAIAGRKFVSEQKAWTIPLTVTNIDKIKEMGFELSDELNEWYEKHTQGITSEISIPGLDHILKPYQKEAVSFIEAKKGRALIADDMGLGKTLEAIAWMQLKGKEIYPVLIVCPATLKINWKREIVKWTDLGDDVEILYGTAPYEITKPIMIINYDILFDWYEYLLKHNTPKLLVMDELHYCKSRGSGFKKQKNGTKKKVILTQRSYSVEEMAKKTQYAVGLTGTPFLNRPVEGFNQIKIINPRLFPNFMQYADRYCNPKFNGFAMTYTGASNTTELHQILSKEVMLRRKKEDVLKDLPPKTRAVIPFEITNSTKYYKAENDFIKYLTEIDPEKAKRAKRAEALAKMNALRQLAVEGKMKAVIDWTKDIIENEKLVLFTWHQKILDKLYKSFSKVAVKVDGRVSATNRDNAITSFQEDDNTRLFLGQINAAGVGITLTAASNVGFVEYPWSPGVLIQAEDRCHRIGQEGNVNIWNLVAYNTIEEDMVVKLEEKARVIASIMDGDDSDDAGLFNELIDHMKKKGEK